MALFNKYIDIFKKWTLPIILLIGLVLRLINLGSHSYFGDEVYSINAAKGSFSSIFSACPMHAPLHHYILYFWLKIFGESEFWTRLPSVIFGVILVYLIYKIAAELDSKKTAVIAALISSFSPFLILFNQTTSVVRRI